MSRNGNSEADPAGCRKPHFFRNVQSLLHIATSLQTEVGQLTTTG
jgi:hypothetical protein